MSKHKTELQEKAFELYDKGIGKSKIAKQLGVPVSTVADWIKKRELPEEVVLKKAVEKIDFVTQSTDIIEKSMQLMTRRLESCIDFENEFAAFMEMLSSDEELSKPAYKAIVSKLSILQIAKTSDLTSMVGTLYDKRALAKGESTASTTIKVEMDEDISEWAQ